MISVIALFTIFPILVYVISLCIRAILSNFSNSTESILRWIDQHITQYSTFECIVVLYIYFQNYAFLLIIFLVIPDTVLDFRGTAESWPHVFREDSTIILLKLI